MGINYQNLYRKLLSIHAKAGYLRDRRIQKILGDIPLELLFTPDQLNRFILQDSPVLFYYRDETECAYSLSTSYDLDDDQYARIDRT